MSDYRKFDAALQSAGVCYKTDEPMSAHTSFKIGGPADRFVEVKTVSELQAVLNAVSDGNVPYFILGNGSNLLVPDEGLRGAVLTLLFGTPRAAVMQRTLEYALMQDDPQAANEIGSHIYYLADKGYVKCYLGDEVLSLVQDPPREALVRLTAKGIDLMEGTLDDEGVAFGDPMRQ